MAGHGEYQAGRGWFDASLSCWVDHPTKITKVSVGQAAGQRPDLGVPITSRPPLADRVAASAAQRWQPNAEYEQVRNLRDSDQVEHRQLAGKMLRGRLRLSIADYEAGLSAHLAAGGELPEGVRKP